MSLPFILPDLFRYSRRVFSHYFYPFPLSIDNQPSATDYYNTQYLNPQGENGKYASVGGYLRSRPLPVPVQTVFSPIVNMQIEVKTAIARGITGFTFDILSFADAISPTGHLQNMLTAAQSVDPRFMIVPMLDMSSLVGLTTLQAVQILESVADSLSVARVPDGRMLVSAFNATLEPLSYWEEVISELAAKNINIAFVPVLLGSPITSPLSSVSIGVGGWGTADPAIALGPASFMQPVLTQQFRPKDAKFWESSGFDTFRNGFTAAIRDNSQYIQIITWSDFSESGQVQPYTDGTLNPNIGTAFYDLTAYYASWFASGVQPQITQDTLYWCHRRMASTALHPNQPTPFTVVGNPEVDNIELLAFLTEPATLSINGSTLQAPAGITSFKTPASPGKPFFSVTRSYTGPLEIVGPEGSQAGTLDMTYWCGSL